MKVPERYVRDQDERPAQSKVIHSREVPIIDMSKLAWSTKGQAQDEFAKRSEACKEYGFFQVVNHGIEHSLLESMEMVAKEFFVLPLEEKVNNRSISWHRGRFRDMGTLLSSQKRTLHKKPKAPAHKTSSAFRSLGLAPDIFNDMFGEVVPAVRMNYYPPCSRPDLVLGLSPRYVGSALISAASNSQRQSLGVYKSYYQGSSSTLRIHFEVLTNGKYKSVEHRAATNKERARLICGDNNNGEYSRHYVTNKLQGKKPLEYAKIQTSF